MKLKSFPFAAVLFIHGFLSVPLAHGETLSGALDKMLKHEPELQAAYYDSLASTEEIGIARSEARPHVSLNGSAGTVKRDRSLDGVASGADDPLFSRQFGVSVRQLLFDVGATKGRVKVAKHNAEVQKHLENGMRESRAVDLAEVYLEVIRSREQIKAAQENVEVHEAIVNKLKERVANGQSASDLALVQGRLGLARTLLFTQELALELAGNRYELLTGERPSGSLTMPPAAPLPAALGSLDLSNNWEYRAAQEAVEAANAQEDATRRDRLPKVHFDGGYSVGEDVLGVEGSDNEARALITMSWDLMKGGANQAMQRRNAALESKARELMRAAELQRSYNAANLWMEMQGSVNTLDALNSYSEKLNRVGADYEELFNLGKRELLAILDIKNEQHSARSRLVDARFNRLTSGYRILGVQGQLIGWLQGGYGGAAASKPVAQVEKR